jgi:hypothetical protein
MLSRFVCAGIALLAVSGSATAQKATVNNGYITSISNTEIKVKVGNGPIRTFAVADGVKYIRDDPKVGRVRTTLTILQADFKRAGDPSKGLPFSQLVYDRVGSRQLLLFIEYSVPGPTKPFKTDLRPQRRG